MAYTEIVDAFYGKNADTYKEIQTITHDGVTFGLPQHLTFEPESFDDLTIAEIGGQKHCFVKYSGYQFYVTEGQMVQMSTREDRKEFTQKICDPQTRNSTTYGFSDFGDGVVDVSVEQERVLPDGKVEKSSFSIHLQATADFWKNLKLGVMTDEQFINYCVNNSTTALVGDELSTYGATVGEEQICLTEEKYSASGWHLREDFYKYEKSSLDKQIEWFDSNHRKQFINDYNSGVFEMFKKIEPRLRELQKKKKAEQAQQPVLGDNLKALMDSHRVDHSKKIGD